MPKCHIVGIYPAPAMVEDRLILYNAVRLLANRFLRQLPVVDREGRAIGVIAIRDVLRYLNDVVSRGESILDALSAASVRNVARIPAVTLTYGRFSIFDVFNTMKEKGIGLIPITSEDGRLIGIVNEEHLASLIKNNSYVATGLRVDDIATSPAIGVPLNTTFADALRVMGERGFRHLPVLDEKNRPIMIVTARDLLRFIMRDSTIKLLEAGKQDEVLKTPITHIGRPEPVRVETGTNLDEALSIMAIAGIGGLLIVDEDERLKGIVTDMDIVTRLPDKLGETFDRLVEKIVPLCP